MDNFIFQNPCKIIFGKDTVKSVGLETARYGKKVLLVTGGSSVKRIGLYNRVIEELKKQNLDIYEISGVQSNPRLTLVYEGIELCKREKVDFILAVGGGSVIDTAKSIAAGTKYNGDVWDLYLRKAEVKEALPVGVVLTVAATGSEMNTFSIISKWETKEKRGIGSQYLIPKFSILDPGLTVSVPKDHTVYGICDIMAHVFEQYFSQTPDTALQDRFAESILQTIIETARVVLKDPNNYEARASIMWCATMAFNGMIVLGKTKDGATHAIEHEVSALYDIPHGAGVAIIFPEWMKYVFEAGIGKFKQFAERVWHIDSKGKDDREVALEGIKKTREFFSSIGAPSSFSAFNIGSENISLMAERAVKFGPVGNYKKLNQHDVENILKSCL